MGGINSQDENISSESVQDESIGKHSEGQTKPIFVMANPELNMNALHAGGSQSMTQIPFAYADPYYSGLYAAYGPQVVIQPRMSGPAPPRVPLPLELAEDGPIYVNAKQYHGILRRRQTRAKLEAQNKLVKSRKPYLHESRHLHALNRVRGSGGRFLSTKKSDQLDAAALLDSQVASHMVHCQKKGGMGVHFQHSETGKRESSDSPFNVGIACSAVGVDSVFQQQVEHGFSSIASHMGVPIQGSGGFIPGGTQYRARVVR